MTERATEVRQLLNEIRDGQKQQISMQRQALDLQLENHVMLKEQFGRANKIQDRAEAIQKSGANMMESAKRSVKVILPIILVLLFALGWLVFRMF